MDRQAGVGLSRGLGISGPKGRFCIAKTWHFVTSDVRINTSSRRKNDYYLGKRKQKDRAGKVKTSLDKAVMCYDLPPFIQSSIDAQPLHISRSVQNFMKLCYARAIRQSSPKSYNGFELTGYCRLAMTAWRR
jgi:hypothetical protein